jgi:hypothetical protein
MGLQLGEIYLTHKIPPKKKNLVGNEARTASSYCGANPLSWVPSRRKPLPISVASVFVTLRKPQNELKFLAQSFEKSRECSILSVMKFNSAPVQSMFSFSVAQNTACTSIDARDSQSSDAHVYMKLS